MKSILRLIMATGSPYRAGTAAVTVGSGRLRQRVLLTGLFAVSLLAGACTVDPRPDIPQGDQPAEQQLEAGIPQEHRAKALAHARDRQIDACGLHDPAAAEKATGDKGDELLPGSGGMHECDLRLHKGEWNSTWRFNVEVGALFDAGSRKSAAPENIAGLDIFLTESEGRCEVAKPIDDNFAIVLVAGAPTGDDAPTKAPCQVLREYVTALAPTWKDLPKRGSGRTNPEFTLTRIDPCAAAAATMDLFAQPMLETSSPVTCTARSMTPAPPQQRQKGVGRDEVTVTWVMDDDPAKLVRAGDDSAREFTVDGRKAVLFKGSGGCTTSVVWDPEVSVVADNRTPEDEILTQQIRISTATCENAETVAQKIVAKVGGK